MPKYCGIGPVELTYVKRENSMTEDIYAKPDFTKKIRFQTDVKEDRNPDVHHDIDDVRIYDNYCAEEITPPEKSQDNTTKEQQQSIYLPVSYVLQTGGLCNTEFGTISFFLWNPSLPRDSFC